MVFGLLRDKLIREFPTAKLTMVDGCNRWKIECVDRHGSRQSHISIVNYKDSKENPSQTAIAQSFSSLTSDNLVIFRALFNSVHCSAMQDWSFNSYHALMELQKKNGLIVGSNYYQNIHGPRMFLKYIAEVQRIATRQIIQQYRFFSVMADGSTDRSIAEQESVYIRLVIEGEPVNLFVGLQELESGDSSGSFVL